MPRPQLYAGIHFVINSVIIMDEVFLAAMYFNICYFTCFCILNFVCCPECMNSLRLSSVCPQAVYYKQYITNPKIFFVLSSNCQILPFLSGDLGMLPGELLNLQFSIFFPIKSNLHFGTSILLSTGPPKHFHIEVGIYSTTMHKVKKWQPGQIY